MQGLGEIQASIIQLSTAECSRSIQTRSWCVCAGPEPGQGMLLLGWSRYGRDWHLEWKLIPYLSPLTPYRIPPGLVWVPPDRELCLWEVFVREEKASLWANVFDQFLQLCLPPPWHSPTCPVHRQLPPCLPKVSEAVRNAKWKKSEAKKPPKFGVTPTTLSFTQRRLKNEVEVVSFKNN